MTDPTPIAIGVVVKSSPATIQIKIGDHAVYESHKTSLQIGKYVKIQDGNSKYVIGLIRDAEAVEPKEGEPIRFFMNIQPVGSLHDDMFERGGFVLPSPMEPVFLMDETTLALMFSERGAYTFPFGVLAQDPRVPFKIDGNRFFSKHVAIVGSTGSGKSCTVAKILQELVGICDCKNLHKDAQKNSHVIIFDMHSEYPSAFKMHADEKFTLNVLDPSTLRLPYWLMNSEELEALFIESNEQNSHNQISQFKRAVILNKEKHNPGITNVTYDSPLYFSIREVHKFIQNMNAEVIGKMDGEGKPKLKDGTLVEDLNSYFDKVHEFIPSSTSKDAKACNGPFHGEFDRFISRMETKISDRRLGFLLEANVPYPSSANFADILQQFLGYMSKSNITIVDLSGIPFEVLGISVSLIARLIFDFAFHYTKLKSVKQELNDVPFMLVCEEAHNYVPRDGGAEYKASRKSIERIAKEGRKYGLSLMIVSQRPSEVSETICAQCNNFIALRLTNVNDQNYVRSLLPDNMSGVADVLPILSSGECLVVGDATSTSSVIRLAMPNPAPRSQSIAFHERWKEDWKSIRFEDVVDHWRAK